MRDTPPKAHERLLCALAPCDGEAIGEYCGIHRAGARRADPIDRDPRFLEQSIQHAPGEGAMGATALER